jgi:hypothetical protein
VLHPGEEIRDYPPSLCTGLYASLMHEEAL